MQYSTETGSNPMDEWISVNLKYWTTRRRLLKRFRAEIEPFHGKTETTVRFPQSVRDAADALMEWDNEHPTMCADKPEYRMRVPGGRVLRIGTIGIDKALDQCEAMIHRWDTADTYDYTPQIESWLAMRAASKAHSDSLRAMGEDARWCLTNAMNNRKLECLLPEDD